jgi:hypothetical protein
VSFGGFAPCSVEDYGGFEAILFRDWLNEARPVLTRSAVAGRLKSGAEAHNLQSTSWARRDFRPTFVCKRACHPRHNL